MPRGASRTGGRQPRSSGFSLLELLVVLAIVAAAIIAVPNITGALPGMRLRAAADGMVATLRGLHEEAIRRRITTELTLDPVKRNYRTSTAPTDHTLPAVVTEIDFTSSAIAQADPQARIFFFADGSASGGTIRLSHGALSASIAVDWLTGRVSRRD